MGAKLQFLCDKHNDFFKPQLTLKIKYTKCLVYYSKIWASQVAE